MTNYLPQPLLRSLSLLDQFDAHAFQTVHDSGEQVVSVHMNPGKPILEDGHWPVNMQDPPFQISRQVPWAPDAWYLSSRPFFTLDPLFHAGAYYVQEASGMFLAFALKHSIDLTRDLRVLDLCAAPGGKSTMIQSLISPGSLLLSNEVIKTRVPVLYQNMTKWGMANGIISQNDAAHFKQLSGFFDLVIIDAPCSGSGLFRRDPEAASTWSLDNVRLCSQRQQRILADAWDCLKEEGILIYSTCSYSKEENEDILDMLFQQFSCISLPLKPNPDWNIIESVSEREGAYGYRFYPDKVLGEGFFLSVIQKKQTTGQELMNKSRRRIEKPGRKQEKLPKKVERYLNPLIKEGSYTFIMVGESVHALPDGILNDFEILKNTLYLKKAGIRLGKAGENDWIPDAELALADILKEETASLDVEKPDALKFLRGEPFETHTLERGWRIVRYLGQRIGWVKMLDKRMNNYYPKSWRIRQ